MKLYAWQGEEGGKEKKNKDTQTAIRYSRKLRSQWHEGFKEQLTLVLLSVKRKGSQFCNQNLINLGTSLMQHKVNFLMQTEG